MGRKLAITLVGFLCLLACRVKGPVVVPTPAPAPQPTVGIPVHHGASVLQNTTTIAAESGPNTAMSAAWNFVGSGVPPTTPTPTPTPNPSGCDLNTVMLTRANGGGNGQAPFTMTPGVPMVISMSPTGAYQNNYYYVNVGATTATQFSYSTQWRIPAPADLGRYQAIETDLHAAYTDGWSYTGGVQFLSARGGGPAVRIYNLQSQAWQSTGLTMPLTDNNYHSLSYTFSINTSAHTLLYQTITIDGVTTTLNTTVGGNKLNWSPLLNAAVQQDGDSSGDSYTLNVQGWHVTPVSNPPAGCAAATPTPTPPPNPTPTPQPTPTPSNVIYVATTGSDSNPGTLQAPLATIQHGNDIATSGTAVIVENGQYGAFCTNTGLAVVNATTSGVTFASQNPFGAQIVMPAKCGSGFNVTGSNVTIRGFDISGGGTPGPGTDGGATGIFLNGGSNHTVFGNYIHNIGNIASSTTNGMVGVFIQTQGDLIDSNRIIGVGRTGGSSLINDHGLYIDAALGAGSTTVQNNVIGATMGWPIQFFPGTLNNQLVINNTFDGTLPPASTRPSGCIVQGGTLTNSRIANNICYNAPGTFIYATCCGASNSNVTIDHNLTTTGTVTDNSSGTTQSANIVNGNGPTFFNNVATGDYHLASNSPAIGQGSPNGAPPFDYDGRARTTVVDIGAYAFAGSAPAPTPTPSPTPAPGGGSSKHIIFVMEENHPQSSVNSSTMPFLTNLGNTYAQTTNLSAIAAGSLLDYIAKAGGQLGAAFGCNGTNCGAPFTADNEYRQFIQNGLSWKLYAQSLPSACYMGDPNNNNGPYVKRHTDAPWMSDVINSPTQQCNIVPFTQWAGDVANNQLPNYSFIVPDLNNDAHNGSLQQADSFLNQALTPLLNSPYCTGSTADCVIIVTFDETSSGSECCVTTVIAGARVKRGVVITDQITAYEILRLTMELFGINDFPGASASATDALLKAF